jgi:hypothetical protein
MMNQGNSGGSQAAEKVTPASEDDVLDILARDITGIVQEACAKMVEAVPAELYGDVAEFQRSVAADIRRLKLCK